MPFQPVDILVPTYNNAMQLKDCIESILATRNAFPLRMLVINNGDPALLNHVVQGEHVKFIQAPENLGWEGGLKLGLQHSTSKYVMFCNDDIFIPRSQLNWLRNMMGFMGDKSIAAVGPSTNCAMGQQNIWPNKINGFYYTRYLIGFCMLLRRSALDEVGGVDDTLPGGDDIDLSIRLRDKGYTLIADHSTFVYHHGFQTGTRVHGGPDQPNGWNSQGMTEKTNTALIKKHGFRKWYETLYFHSNFGGGYYQDDSEGKLIREMLGDEGSVLELGCGGMKTVPRATGVDLFEQNVVIPIINQPSCADIRANVEKLDLEIPDKIGSFDFIVARHILEHVVDPLDAIERWAKFLKPGGDLIIAVPNEEVCQGIPMNPEHKHCFTPKSLSRLYVAAGLKPVAMGDPGNMVSFIIRGRKEAPVLAGVC